MMLMLLRLLWLLVLVAMSSVFLSTSRSFRCRGRRRGRWIVGRGPSQAGGGRGHGGTLRRLPNATAGRAV